MAGCAESAGGGPRSGQFEDVFAGTAQVQLDEPADVAIGAITDLVAVDDRLVISDQLSHRVVAFDLQGNVIATAGGFGQGPGEFRGPHSLESYRDGSVFVADASQRLTQLTKDLELLGVHRVDIPYQVRDISTVGDELAITLFNPREAGENIVLWTPERGLGRRFDLRSPLLQVPYWGVVFTTSVVSTPARVFVADNMIYPIRMYSPQLELADSVGSPPPSWVQARQPEVGEFDGAIGPRSELRAFLRSFTRVHMLAVLDDRYLLVSHRYPVGEYSSDDQFRLDVYDTAEGVVKVWEDVPLPGRLLSADSCAWFVLDSPPAPWSVGCYRLARGR